MVDEGIWECDGKLPNGKRCKFTGSAESVDRHIMQGATDPATRQLKPVEEILCWGRLKLGKR